MYNGIRVTESVSKALKNAGRIALKYGSYQVGTEHLLYGLTSVTDCVASKILSEYGVNSIAVENILRNNGILNSMALFSYDVELTPRTKEIFLIANQFANQIGHNFIGTEHLLVALTLSDGSFAVNLLEQGFNVDIESLKQTVLKVLKSESQKSPTSSKFEKSSFAQNKNVKENNAVYDSQAQSSLPKEILEMGTDLTLKARQGKIDPVIGRKEEIARVIEILGRKTKNNPVLIGEAGVGKSAIVDGLARAIVNGEVPEILKNKVIFSLELGGLMAGTKFRGELEERLKNLINFIAGNKDIIVFIDEIHTLMQISSEKGEVNPADMLKPYLARGEFQTIGATTTDEYRKYIEKDKALERRFQPVTVNPPSVTDTIEILNGIKDSFEAFHKVVISHEAIVAAATLSDRYITDRNLPDKAIDLIDEASSKAKVKGTKKPIELTQLEDEIEIVETEKKDALFSENFEKAGKCRDKLKELYDRKKELENKFSINEGNIVITSDDICEIINKWTGIPVTKLTENEKDRLMHLEEILHKRVIGQDEAINAVCKAIRRSRVGLKTNDRPIGSFLFLGQTGTGKTELSKALAEAMFDNENAIIRLDMSEYMEKHSVSKLIGSPPGYVGYDEGGQLTEQVRRKPYSVILFDEIEKAHPDVFNILLQILDDGRLTDTKGRTVTFKNTIIILTSNVGVSELPKNNTKLGFAVDNEANEKSYDEMKEVLINAMKRKFKPEFINRIDVITVFHPLTFEQLANIAKIFISNLNKRLGAKGVNLKVTESALKYLIEKGYDSEYGARPLRRLIEQEIEDRIAELLISNKLRSGTVIVTNDNGELKLKTENN